MEMWFRMGVFLSQDTMRWWRLVVGPGCISGAGKGMEVGEFCH